MNMYYVVTISGTSNLSQWNKPAEHIREWLTYFYDKKNWHNPLVF